MAITAPSAIDDAFRKRFPTSAELYERSRRAIAGGITHDSRNFAPFPIYIERAEGSRKWDVDGNELLDHWMGHGSLILGHGHPQVTAAVILEPGGGSNGIIPADVQFLKDVRALTSARGVVLIFDEVITGFRYSPGGAQQVYGVTPDLTTLAKIVAGGLPGGAVVGKRQLMSMLAFRGDPDWDRSQRVAHAGTFNANPLSAAAAIATLELVADASLQARANKLGEELRRALTDAMKRAGVPGTCYGEASIYHVSFEGKPGLAGFDRPRKGPVYHLLRCALLNHGVDCSMNHGWISAVHSEEDLERTVRAYDAAFRALVAEGVFRS